MAIDNPITNELLKSSELTRKTVFSTPLRHLSLKNSVKLTEQLLLPARSEEKRTISTAASVQVASPTVETSNPTRSSLHHQGLNVLPVSILQAAVANLVQRSTMAQL